MNNALLLKHWTVEEPVFADGVYRFPATYDIQPEACLKCGVVGRLYRHGAKTFEFRDAPVHGRPAIVEVTRQRYRCRDCAETFWQPLPDVDDDTIREQGA